MNIDVQMILNLMTNDIRRAGYIATPRSNNPFTIIHPTNGTSSCFLYSYDANGNGALDGDEFFGFRVSQGAIQTRTQGTSQTDCTNGTWQPLSDPNVMQFDNTTGLVFSITTTPLSVAGTTLTAERRFVNIRLNAQSSSTADGITKLAQTSVEIRNDRRTP
jgi:type II secretory pathway component PulJ